MPEANGGELASWPRLSPPKVTSPILGSCLNGSTKRLTAIA